MISFSFPIVLLHVCFIYTYMYIVHVRTHFSCFKMCKLSSSCARFVLTTAAVLSYFLYHLVLEPLDLAYLKIIVFITVIAGTVQGIQYYIKATSPVLHQLLGMYLPLITSNCAVLGVALLAVDQNLSLLQTTVFSIGAAAGFTGVMVMFGAMRERLEHPDLPLSLRGAPIALITAGLMSLAFMGFQGFPS